MTLQEDSSFGDSIFDVHKDSRRHIRVAVKEYPRGGTYIFFKVFKFEDGDFVRRQYISLTTEEFEALYITMDTIRRSAIDEDDESVVCAGGESADNEGETSCEEVAEPCAKFMKKSSRKSK